MRTRWARRPRPGQPLAKFENSRCREITSGSKGKVISRQPKQSKVGRNCPTFGGYLTRWQIYSWMIPRFNAIVTAWTRSLAPSLERMFVTWLLTVASPMDS
jgi:hypothetical protein